MSEFLRWATTHRWAGALTVAMTTPLLAGFVLLARWPLPQIHDEFAYLLAADTFRQGRLTNQAHPMGRYLQMYHVLMEPTYQAKYPPGTGLFMALGWRVLGEPVWGMVLAMTLASVAMWWALRAAAGNRFAILGAVAMAMLGPSVKWSINYWGGSVALLGGTLACGGVMHMRRSKSIASSLLLGTGVVLLAISRQYEGVVLCLALAVLVLVIDGMRGAMTMLRRAWPAAIIMLIGASWMAYYNYRVTGNAMVSPYVFYERQFAVTPPLLFMPKPPEKTYELPGFSQYYLGRETRMYESHFSSLNDGLYMIAMKYGVGIDLALRNPVLLLGVVLAIIVAWFDRLTRWLLVAAFMCYTGSLASLWLFSHYLAPMLPLVVLAIARATRLVVMRKSFAWVGYLMLVLTPLGGAYFIFDNTLAADSGLQGFESITPNSIRDSINQFVTRDGGKHLVMMPYDAGLSKQQIEFVYNSANIDQQQVVWAHLLDDQKPLLDYFKDRKAWVFDLTVSGEPILFEEWKKKRS
jgi:hypothetical protein